MKPDLRDPANQPAEGNSVALTHPQAGQTVASPNPITSGSDATDGPEYVVWATMHNRCHHEPFFKEQGITVCPRWSEPLGFEHFFADMGPRPAGHRISRIDISGAYSPDNCKWILNKKPAKTPSPKSRPRVVAPRSQEDMSAAEAAEARAQAAEARAQEAEARAKSSERHLAKLRKAIARAISQSD